MACYHPIKGYRAPGGKIVFSGKDGFIDRPVTVSCGQCIGCRLEYSRQWAVRCMHEAQLHERNSFLTLTYDEENLPPGSSLDKTAFPKFIKRWRKHLKTKVDPTRRVLRYYHCGEYGDQSERPHYHACVFGQDLGDDRELYKVTRDGHRLYTSPLLNNLWGLGHAIIGDLSFESAAYVARYVLKKQKGKDADKYYNGRTPEYVTMSRRPGIGKTWYDRYGKEIRDNDFVIVNGKKSPVPKFYDSLSENRNPEEHETTKTQRIRSAQKHQANNTPERLNVRETIQKAKLNLFTSRDGTETT